MKYIIAIAIFVTALLRIDSVQALDVGGATSGDLALSVQNDGSLKIAVLTTSTLIDQTSATSNVSGSLLKTPSGLCSLGYSSVANSTPGTQISNTVTGNTITTVIDCFGEVRWTQEVKVAPGSAEAVFKWTLSNTAANLGNFGFYHIQQVAINSATAGQAFGADGRFFGAFATSSGIRALGILAETPPNRFAVDDATAINSTVGPGLLDFVNQAPSVSSPTVALQWDFGAVPIGGSVTVLAAERLVDVTSNGPRFIIPPPTTGILSGGILTLPYVLFNSSVSSPITLSAIATQARSLTWSASVLSPGAPFNIPTGPTSQAILVSVIAPPGGLAGDASDITLTAVDSTLISNSATTKVIILAPPTLPTVAPTPTATATATPIPDEVNVTFTYPYKSSASRAPKITGLAFPGSTILVSIDGGGAISITADSKGLWAFSSSDLAIGQHTLTAQATDPLSRTSVAPPFSLYVTGGADLDLEGDGLSDVTSYSTLGSSVVFRYRLSSDSLSRVASAKGVVPAVADYDGDTIGDLTAIRRSGKSFIWSANLSANSTTVEREFGQRGDTLVTGCYLSTHQSALAAIRGRSLLFTTINSTAVNQVDGILESADDSFLGCADLTGDHIDELIFANESSSMYAKTTSGQKIPLPTRPKFTRAYVVRRPLDTQPNVSIVRSANSTSRALEVVNAVTTESIFKASVPRKLIVGSGYFFSPAGNPQSAALYQDLSSGKVFRTFLVKDAEANQIATLSRKVRLLAAQYAYPTK